MIPNMLAEVEKCKADHPKEWASAHTGGPGTEDFIRLLATRLHRIEPRFGLNGKRGNPLDISDDAINWIGEGPGHDPSTGLPVTVFDVIRGAGGPTPQPSWDRIDLAGPGAWVQSGGTAPLPAPSPIQPYPDETSWWGGVYEPAVAACYREAGKQFPDNSAAFRWFSRCGYSIGNGMTKEAAMEKCIKELRSALGL